MMQSFDLKRSRLSAFTLIEVLVVVAIIALLISILLPSLAAARTQSRSVVCLSNLHQIGLAVATYSSEYKGYIPRGGTLPRDPHWTVLMLSKQGVKAQGMGAVEANKEMAKRPVFHCPQRAASTVQREIVSYVVNAFTGRIEDALNTSGGRGEQGQVTRESSWKHPGQVIYLADFELAEVSPYVLERCAGDNAVNCADVYQLWSLPSAAPVGRRVARGMHSKLRTNSLYVDGHATGVNSLPLAGEPEFDMNYQTGTYARRWARAFGVELP